MRLSPEVHAFVRRTIDEHDRLYGFEAVRNKADDVSIWHLFVSIHAFAKTEGVSFDGVDLEAARALGEQADPDAFDPANVRIERVRIERVRPTTAQGSVNVRYSDELVGHYGDEVTINASGEWVGLPDDVWIGVARAWFVRRS